MIEYGCMSGVIACDGCAINSAAAAVTASALNLRNVVIYTSLRRQSHLVRVCSWTAAFTIRRHSVNPFFDLDQLARSAKTPIMLRLWVMI
jgi:hypothetical protein